MRYDMIYWRSNCFSLRDTNQRTTTKNVIFLATLCTKYSIRTVLRFDGLTVTQLCPQLRTLQPRAKKYIYLPQFLFLFFVRPSLLIPSTHAEPKSHITFINRHLIKMKEAQSDPATLRSTITTANKYLAHPMAYRPLARRHGRAPPYLLPKTARFLTHCSPHHAGTVALLRETLR